jgi:plastocyanin
MSARTARTSPITAAISLAGLALALISTATHAEDHVVNAVGVKYAPMISYIEPGDRIVWRNMIGHNVETMDSMVPEGQEKILSELGADITATFDEVGIVVYKCTPHWTSRMGGIIVVGKPDDPEAIIDAYLASIETDRSALPAKGLLKKLRRDMESKGLIEASAG